MELHPIKQPHLLRYQPGDQAGGFTVLRALGSKRFKRGVAVVFEVRCQCGAVVTRDRQTLIKNSHGCESCRSIGTSPPGGSKHPLYKSWSHMIDRCHNENGADWKNYGGRGIGVCEDWIAGRDGLTGLEAFALDMGERPKGGSIERVDNDAGYSPGNCIWASKLTQSRNRRGLHLVTWRGETRSVGEWAEIRGIPYFTLMRRIKLGWDAERAMTQKIRGRA